MEKFEKPELFNFLCYGDFNDLNSSPNTESGIQGGPEGGL